MNQKTRQDIKKRVTKKRNREVGINIRLLPEEKKHITELAKACKLSVSEMFRQIMRGQKLIAATAASAAMPPQAMIWGLPVKARMNNPAAGISEISNILMPTVLFTAQRSLLRKTARNSTRAITAYK